MVKIDSWSLPTNTNGEPRLEISNLSLTVDDTNTNTKLSTLLDRTKTVIQDQVEIKSVSGISMMGAEQKAQKDENGRDGWLFEKSETGTAKFNYYFYSDGSHPFQLSTLNNVYMTVSIDRYDNIASVPFIVVYTKPLGDGNDSYPGFYKSKILYTIDSTKKISVGEIVNLYCIADPKLNNGLRSIQLETITTTGTASPTEEIRFLTVHSDSASLINTKILVSDVGYSLNNEIERHISLKSNINVDTLSYINASWASGAFTTPFNVSDASKVRIYGNIGTTDILQIQYASELDAGTGLYDWIYSNDTVPIATINGSICIDFFLDCPPKFIRLQNNSVSARSVSIRVVKH